MPYVRTNFFKGEEFIDLANVRARAETWCTTTAGMRVHGTTQLHPLDSFRIDELPLLVPRPGTPFDVPMWSTPVVHRDFHCEVGKALYSVNYTLRGKTLRARRDSVSVKVYLRGELVKLHPRKAPGQHSSDPADYPPGTEVYAMRDIGSLIRRAHEIGPAVGTYAAALLDSPLPWTKMRQVYRLLGLAKKWGEGRLEAACRRALDAEAIDVNLVSRMLERAREDAPDEERPGGIVVQGRFARDASAFSSKRAQP